VAKLSATGTPSASTFLRGDGTWNAPAGGVTSLAAGNGIAVSASTGDVTVSLDFYTGSTASNTSYPIGSYIYGIFPSDSCVYGPTNINQTFQNGVRVYTSGFSYFYYGSLGSTLAGTWRSRSTYGSSSYMAQRTA
jgi:hypothetical protein